VTLFFFRSFYSILFQFGFVSLTLSFLLGFKSGLLSASLFGSVRGRGAYCGSRGCSP
jgi:hypothetical protein